MLKLLFPRHPCDEKTQGLPSALGTKRDLCWFGLAPSVTSREGKPLPTAVNSYQDCCCPEGPGSSVPGLWGPFPWHVEGTGDTSKNQYSPSCSNLLRPAMESHVHRAQIPPSWWHSGTQEQDSETRLSVGSASPALPAAVPKPPSGTFPTEDSGHINSPPELLFT